MDVLQYDMLNVIPQDMPLMENVDLKKLELLSSNYRGDRKAASIKEYLDYDSADGRVLRFYGIFNGDDSQFSDAETWLRDLVVPEDVIAVLLCYNDQRDSALDVQGMEKFAAVITNQPNEIEVSHMFTPLPKGKAMAAVSILNRDDVSGQRIVLDQSVLADAEMLELVWHELSELAKRQEEAMKAKYLDMSPEQFMNLYQGGVK